MHVHILLDELGVRIKKTSASVHSILHTSSLCMQSIDFQLLHAFAAVLYKTTVGFQQRLALALLTLCNEACYSISVFWIVSIHFQYLAKIVIIYDIVLFIVCSRAVTTGTSRACLGAGEDPQDQGCRTSATQEGGRGARDQAQEGGTGRNWPPPGHGEDRADQKDRHWWKGTCQSQA